MPAQMVRTCAQKEKGSILKKLLFRGTLVLFAFFALAGPALANDVFFNWTLNFRILNNGGGPLHHLDTGNLTSKGQVWPYSTDAGHTATPVQVNIDVYHEGGFIDNLVCHVAITPNTTFNVGKQYTNTGCGQIGSGDFYITVWKGTDDGWNLKGQGDLISPS
jgi:hypothetical protein